MAYAKDKLSFQQRGRVLLEHKKHCDRVRAQSLIYHKNHKQNEGL